MPPKAARGNFAFSGMFGNPPPALACGDGGQMKTTANWETNEPVGAKHSPAIKPGLCL
jgi:hypothetical protein